MAGAADRDGVVPTVHAFGSEGVWVGSLRTNSTFAIDEAEAFLAATFLGRRVEYLVALANQLASSIYELVVILAHTLAGFDIEERPDGAGNAIAILEEKDPVTDCTDIALETVAFLALAFLEDDVVGFVDTARVDALDAVIVASFLTFAADKRVFVDLVETLVTDTFAVGLRATEGRTLGSFWPTLSINLNIALIADALISNRGTVLVTFFDAFLLMLPVSLIADASISDVLAVGRAGHIGDTFVVLFPVSVIANTSDSIEVRVVSAISLGRGSRSDDKTDSHAVAGVHIQSVTGAAGTSIVCPIGKLEIGAIFFTVCFDELFSTWICLGSLRLRSWSGLRGRLRVGNI